MTLKIEAGKYYRDRSGDRIGPMAVCVGEAEYPWFGAGRLGVGRTSAKTYAADGRYHILGNWPQYDLVAEWIDEPLKAPQCEFTVPDPETVATTFAPLEAQTPRATDIAGRAAELVGGDRDRQHGAKRDNFARIAGVWNAWLGVRRDAAAPLDAHDVGVMMALMKLARTQSGSFNLDDYIDACGYAACAGEVGQSKL